MTNDRYQILGPCGEGGMACVSKARDTKLDRLVAIKQMSPDLEHDQEAVQAFQNEAKILAGLSHPNIVRVYDSLAEEGHYYFVMEYIEGEHLGKLIRRGPAAVEEGERILKEVLSGLETMHHNKVFHQDLKPSNILMDSGRTPKITDFGLATRGGDDGPPLDWGSVQYLAPEIYSNTYQPDARQDIYALGMVAYQLFLGEAAFRAECREIYEAESGVASRWVNWHQNPQKQFRKLSDIDAKIPEHVSRIVARMLAKNPETRYADVGSVLKDLKDKRQWEQQEGRVDDPDKTEHIGEFKTTPPKPPVRTASAAKRPNRKLLYVGGAVSILMFVALVMPHNRPVAGSVSSTPGAELTVDNRRWGLIPAGGTMHGRLERGSHTARLTLRNYETVEATLEVKSSPPWQLQAPLKPLKAPEPAARLELPSGNMLLVPAGEFIYGKDNRRGTLPAFYMDQTEVTNAAYRKFCEATARPNPPNPAWDRDYFLSKGGYPVVNVTWDDAVAFAQWAGKRLPAELEWEKAARGTDGRIYPWGAEFDAGKANLGVTKPGGPASPMPVGSFPGGASPGGMLDMAGNVWEWVADAYGTAAGMGPEDRVLKGGGFRRGSAPGANTEAAAFFHEFGPRAARADSVGFRCARDIPTAAARETPPAEERSHQ